MYGSFDDKGDEFVMEDPYSLELQLGTIVNILLAKHGSTPKPVLENCIVLKRDRYD